ncbi:MAG: GAF domain-containing sensor histidine kinase [Chloroflexota bacterium]|nr:GAF domain-containing sensor histidine kinase [Chloroflexota bacterium]
MNQAVSPTTPIMHAGQTDIAGARLCGYQLLAVRTVWLTVATVSVGLFAVSIPPYYAELLTMSGPHTEWAPDSVRTGLDQLGIPLRVYALYSVATMIALAVVFVGTGALVFWRKPDDRAALFFSLTLVVFGAIWPNTLDSLANVHPALGPPSKALSTWGFASFFLLFCLFPDGRFVPRWTRWTAAVLVIQLVLAEHFPDFPLGADNWPAILSIPLYVGLLGSVIVAPVYRYRRASGPMQRQQLKWVTYSLVMALVSFVGVGSLSGVPVLNEPGVPAALYALSGPIAFGMVFMLVPASVGIAVLRYRLWDIDPIINRTLVYGALTAIVVGLYVLTVGYLGAIFQTDTNLLFSLAATGLIAVLFQPLRERLQRGVNRLMYGERDEPYRVLSRLGQRLEAALVPDVVLPTVVETVREALKLPYTAISLGRGEHSRVVAMVGTAVGEPLRLPLLYHGEQVGELLLGRRIGESTFSPADRRLLADLARQAGVAAHAVQLTSDLQRSRERLVTAREEERRRLRRDLHDGLESRLAALNLQVGALRGLIRQDPDAAEETVAELRGEVRAAIADIRRLVYELRPPALDELGLVAAIRQRASQFYMSEATEQHSVLQVTVDAPEQFTRLPAAVEVAAYRIAEEALTNVARHARARSCTVRLTIAEGELRLEITDDGVGLPANRRAGVGLLSMRERAEELGGSCDIEMMREGGTRVLARLPVVRE